MDQVRSNASNVGRPPRLLLAMPDVAARTGGIAMVGRSLLRLLARRHSQGEVDYRAVSLRGPSNAAEERHLQDWCGTRLTSCGDSRWRFSREVLTNSATWADLTVFTHVGLASLLPLVPRPVRPASIVFIHGIEVWSPLSARKRKALRCCSRIVAITQFTAEKARAANPWLPPTTSCHLGIPAEHFSSGDLVDVVDAGELETRLGFSPRRHDIAIVGRMAQGEGQKGHAELIGAMESIVRAVPDARLLIVGGGNDIQRYRELARQSSASEHILFAGFLSEKDLESLYAGCGVFAMPSRQEGFGLVYLEAMRAGLPCVASNCDAAQEVIADGETGHLVDPDNRSDLASAVTRLLTDPASRSAMGAAGRSRFLSRFTERHFHDRFWQAVSLTLRPEACGV